MQSSDPVGCMCRRNVRLELQQPGMERRRLNSTRYLSYQRRLQWRVEWRFPGAADLSISDARCRVTLVMTLKDAGSIPGHPASRPYTLC